MNENARAQRVVVGVDASKHAAKAAEWAAAEAEAHDLELHLVHALNFPAQVAMASAVPFEEYRARAHAAGQRVLDDVLEPLKTAHPKLTISAEVVEVGPAEALVELSAEARLVVTGSRGHGGFTGLLLGSVSLKLASHAHCPAVIVRD